MEINRKYEKIIDLRDLFFHLLYRWRGIVLAALIGAALLGAMQHFKVQRIHSAGKQTAEEIKYEAAKQSHDEQVANCEANIRINTALLDSNNEYLAESVYMSLNPQQEWQAVSRFYVQLDPSVLEALPAGSAQDPADYVLPAYQYNLKSDLNAPELAELMGTDRPAYIDELVTVSMDAAANTVSVRIVGPDEATVEAQQAFFTARLMNECQATAQQIAPHTLIKLSEDVRAVVDTAITDKQADISKKNTTYQTAIVTNRDQLQSLRNSAPKKPGEHLVRYAVIGFMLGAVLWAGLQLILYAARGRLHTAGELQEHYALASFGQFARSRARRPGKGIDALIEKWEFGRGRPADEVVCDGAAALIREKYSGGRVLLAGSLPEAEMKPVCEALRARLGDDVALEARGGFLGDSGAIAAAGRADAVVLVERLHESRTADIDREIDVMNIGGAKVGGFLLA